MPKPFIKNLKSNSSFLIFFSLISFSFGFNYLNYVILSNFLPQLNFGIFYTSIVLLNILITPCVVFNFYISKVIVNEKKDNRIINIQEKFSNLITLSFFYFIILQLSFYLFSIYYNINYSLYFVVTLITLLQFYIEYLRLILDINKHYIRSSTYTFFFNFLKLIFCSVLVLMNIKVSIILLGFLFSQVLIIFHFYNQSHLKFNLSFLSLKEILNFDFFVYFIFFVFMVCFAYTDVILSYFLFTNVDNFSNYSSSSVLPKSILMFSLPFLKAMYPNLHNQIITVRKVLVLFFSIFFISFLILLIVYLSYFYFPSILKIKNVDPSILFYSCWSTFCAIMTIFLILYNLANRNYKSIFIGFILCIFFIINSFLNTKIYIHEFTNSVLYFYGFSFGVFFILSMITLNNFYKK